MADTSSTGSMPHGHLRVTNQDRERVVDQVKAAYAEGRFDRIEFDDRLERAMTARTHADLSPIMSELYGMNSAPPHSHGAASPTPSTYDAFPRTATRSPFDANHSLGSKDRLGGAAAHWLALVGLPIVGPLVLLVTMSKTSPYIRHHALESLNFHLTVAVASFLLPLTGIGVVLTPLLWIAAFVLAIVGGISALAENSFRYPLTIRLLK